MALEIPKRIADSKTNTDLVRNVFGSIWDSLTGRNTTDGKEETKEEGKTPLETSGVDIPSPKIEA